jgi:putative hydrolase of the HAD superfamily
VSGAGLVLWDFDGTLAWRPGLWGACVLEVLDELAPGHTGTLELVRRELANGFPWHRHEDPHPQLCDAERWWEALTPRLARAIESSGVERGLVPQLARAVRARFTDGTRGWQVFADSRAALERAGAAGWRSVILSNHVPELEALVSQLGLGDLVERVFSSARIGYEKPHPQAFRHALVACGEPRRRWMVGDNPVADVAGAEALGIPAILVRGVQRVQAEQPGGASRCAVRWAPDACAAVAMIAA